MTIKRPPTTTFRISASSLLTAVAAIPIGLWVNFLSSGLQTPADLGRIVQKLGWNNAYLVVGAVVVLASLYLQYRWDTQDASWQQYLNTARSRRDLRTQLQILDMYCRSLERALRVPVSGRLFSIRSELNGQGVCEARMYQVRDVYVEHEPFPSEAGFTYITMTGDIFVTGRAFRERTPKYEILPEDHGSKYGARERPMVDPQQKWVLCAPVLQYDQQGQARDELEPTGMVVFYGKKTPRVSPDDADFSLALCRDTAELFSVFGTARE